jgi:hypothetical protein
LKTTAKFVLQNNPFMKNQQLQRRLSSHGSINYSGFDYWLLEQESISGGMRSQHQKQTPFWQHAVKNIMVVLGLTTVCYVCSLSMNLKDVDLSGLIRIFSPCLAGIVTLFLYLFARIFFRPYAWIVSLCGVAYVLFSAVTIYFL